MKLKAVLSSLDGLDDAIKAFYTEKDGSFILNIEGVPEHPEVKTLQTSLTAARKEKSDAVKELKDFKATVAHIPEDFDLDVYNAAVDSGKNIGQQLIDQRTRLTNEKTAAVNAVAAERDKYKAKLQNTLSETALNTALLEVNVAPEMTKAVRAMFAQQVKVEFEGDEPIVTLDDLPVADKIKAWAGTDEGKYFVKAPENGGGGARPNGAGGLKKEYDKMNTTELLTLNGKGDKQAEAELNRRNNEPIKTLN